MADMTPNSSLVAASAHTDGRLKTGLLHLPTEVRLQIYAYLLRLPPIVASDALRKPRVHASVLLVSRRINEEATHVLYGENTFIAHPSLLADFPRLRDWYTPICTLEVLPRIRRFYITVRLDCDLQFDRERAAVAFSGAEELTVNVSQSVFLGASYQNLRKLEDVREVKRLTIRGSTTGFEGYVEWLTQLMQSPHGTVTETFLPPSNKSRCQFNILAGTLMRALPSEGIRSA